MIDLNVTMEILSFSESFPATITRFDTAGIFNAMAKSFPAISIRQTTSSASDVHELSSDSGYLSLNSRQHEILSCLVSYIFHCFLASIPFPLVEFHFAEAVSDVQSIVVRRVLGEVLHSAMRALRLRSPFSSRVTV